MGSQLQNMRSIGETRAKSPPPQIGANLGVVRDLRSAVLALYVQKLDVSKRFGPCTYPHVETSLNFEVLGPRNGRGRTSSKPLKSPAHKVQYELRKCEREVVLVY